MRLRIRLQATWLCWPLAVALMVAGCSAADSAASQGDKDDTASATDSVGAADGAADPDSAVGDGSAELADVPGDATTGKDGGIADVADAGQPDAGTIDGGPADAGPMDVGPADVPPVKVCSTGDSKCSGAQLATCGVYEDGWIISSCFPGMTCAEKAGKGICTPVSNNLIIAFDTSGSMSGKVPGCNKGTPSWPDCDPNKGCSRMDVSKVTFTKALAKIDDKVTRMALLRFPQKLNFKKTGNCTTGYYAGQSILSGETKPGPKDAEFVNESSAWFWETLNETLCVPFPKDGLAKTKENILKWMDGKEAGGKVGACAASSSITCNPAPGCAGTCCPGNECWDHTDPELRPTGGTPIGKTLFYVGEYLKNRVVIDGKSCKVTADCANVNYECQQEGKLCPDATAGCTKGKCVDPARSCRDTIVVLFTDGGQGNSNTFFAPWMQAKRLGFGLGCQTDDDCVGGAVCAELEGAVPVQKDCRRPVTPSDFYCSNTMKPCDPGAAAGTDAHCTKQCVRDPVSYKYNGSFGGKCNGVDDCAAGETCAIPKNSGLPDKHCITAQFYAAPLTADAKNMADNVLRSPDGKPFGVRLFVVDISGASSLANSMSLALAGNGKLLGTDASDPDNFLSTLNQVFDIKNLKVCGTTN